MTPRGRRPFRGFDAPRVGERRRPEIECRGSRAREFIRNSGSAAWAIADQAVISISGFVVLFLPARTLSPTTFSALVLVYTGLLFTNSLQLGLIGQPHNVLGAVMVDSRYRAYTTGVAVQQILFSSVLALGLGLGGVFAEQLHTKIATMLWLAIPALFAWQAQEFVRRVLYTENRLATAFCNDLVSYGGQLFAIIGLWRIHRLTVSNLFVSIIVTSVIAAAWGIWAIRNSLQRKWDLNASVENWRFGRWIAGSFAVHWIAFQAYFYLAALARSSAPGALKAAQLLLGPLNIVFLSMYAVLPTRFARAEGAEAEGWPNGMWRTLRITTPIVTGYCIAVAVLARWLLRLAYRGTYAHEERLVVLFAGYYLALYFTYPSAAAISSRAQSRPLLTAIVVSAGIGIPVAACLIPILGAQAAIIGLICGTVGQNFVLWRTFRRRRGRTVEEGVPQLGRPPAVTG